KSPSPATPPSLVLSTWLLALASAAAFFDLDKTLMEGSSAIHFGRAAYRAGLMSRRQLASDAWANIQFRLKGSTDETTKALWNRILDSIAGKRVEDLARLGPQILSGVLARLEPPMLRTVGHPVVVNPDDALRRVAREEGWEIMLFDRLRRRLRIASLAGAAGLLAAGTGFAAARMTRPTGLRARLGLA